MRAAAIRPARKKICKFLLFFSGFSGRSCPSIDLSTQNKSAIHYLNTTRNHNMEMETNASSSNQDSSLMTKAKTKMTENKNTSEPAVKSIVIKKRNTKFTDSFSEEIFNATYKFAGENDINDRHLAVAKDIASVEKPELQAYWTDKFLDILEDFKFVPGGRITSNAEARNRKLKILTSLTS
jgi:hypothetical protein